MNIPYRNSSGEAFWMGRASPILAWYHQPTQLKRRAGIVLCPPFGHEYLVSYRAYRKLALQLCDAGFAVLRLDYNGTGDSFESLDSEQLVLTWQDNIQDAIEVLKERTGLQTISLIGLRLGALLAASICHGENIDSLVLIAPVVNGRSFIREMQAFQTLAQTQKNQGSQIGSDEFLGYSLPVHLREQLLELDMCKTLKISAKKILLLSRDDSLGSEARLLRHLTQQNQNLEAIDCAGYAKLMKDDAYTAEPPQLMWDALTQSLIDLYPVDSSSIQALPLQPIKATVSAQNRKFQETLIEFDGLFGIFTQALAPLDPSRPVLIMSNVGANHRVSNHRLYVSIARHLAEHGFNVLRFDRAGIGDSPAAQDGLENDVYSMNGIADTQRAMDYLQAKYGIETFILGGLCSAAYFAYKTAAQDPRVVGLTMINILTFDWQPGDSLEIRKRTHLKSTQFYFRSLLTPSTWTRLLRGKIHMRAITHWLSLRFFARFLSLMQSLGHQIFGMKANLSPVAEVLQSLLDRKVAIHCIFDSNDAGIDLLAENLAGASKGFYRNPSFQVDIVDGSDHTFTPRWSQAWLLKTMSAHFQKRFSPVQGSSSDS